MQNRRDFLKTTALAVAGVAVAGCKTGSPQPFNIVKGDGKLHLKFFPYELKLAHVFTVASYSRTTTPDVQVELEWEGVTGYGEASMPPYLGQSVETVTAFLNKVDLSQFTDPFKMEDILGYVDSLSEGDAAAKCAIDIALHDLVGKLLGQPWYKLWGLDPAKAPSEEMIRTIRSVTDVPLAVDANQGWKDRSKALDEIFWLKEHGIVMVEQPMAKERIDDIAWLTERSPLPIFADESIQRMKDIPSLVGAYNGINIKLMKCTGMREGWRMATMARALGMKVMVGCMTETSCAVSAAAQFSPYVDFADLDGNLLIANDRFDGVKVVGGKLSLPDRPGIGVVPLA